MTRRSKWPSLSETKRLLAKMAFCPRTDVVYGAEQQAVLSPAYHRDRAIVLIREITPPVKVQALKRIFVHLMWYAVLTNDLCASMVDQKPAGPTDSAS